MPSRSGAPEYESFLTLTARSRQPSPIRALQPIAAIPGMISLGAGNPNPDAFPMESATITLKNGGQVELDAALMRAALSYTATPGLPDLVAWLRGMQEKYHNITKPAEDWEIACTTGSQDGLSKVTLMLMERGDSIIVEEPCYPGTLAILQPRGVHIEGVQTDSEGVVPEVLDDILERWSERRPGVPKPKVLYTIPTGHNPSGVTTSERRRRAVYALAQKHNLLLLEDDPYYYLQLDGPREQGVCKAPPSYLSMDVDGRVMRFDSMSKVLSSGLRFGFVTGPAPLMKPLVLHMQSATLCTSVFSQACALALLRKWGPEGWNVHVTGVQALYRERRDHFIACAEKHLSGLAEWTVPEAGMFVWIRLLGIADSKALIEGPAREEKVLLVPGNYFSTNPDEPSSYVRASFSVASMDDMDEALRRLAVLLRKHRTA